MIERKFKLFLHPGRNIPLVIHANQYDNGERWLFTLFNEDGSKFIPQTGAIVGLKSDRKAIINTGSVNENGEVVINETKQMTAAPGKNVYELLVEGETHGTANFVVFVEPRPGDNADFSDSDISAIETAIGIIDSIADAQLVAQAVAVSETNAQVATSAANSAQSSANAASVSASGAEVSKNTAKTYRDEAEAFRNDAAGYAGAASYSFYVKTDGIMYMRYKAEEGE